MDIYTRIDDLNREGMQAKRALDWFAEYYSPDGDYEPFEVTVRVIASSTPGAEQVRAILREVQGGLDAHLRVAAMAYAQAVVDAYPEKMAALLKELISETKIRA